MTQKQGERASQSESSQGAISVRNIGEPLRLSNIEPMAGVSAEPAQRGQTMKVWTRLAITSDQPLFHRIVENLERVIAHMVRLQATAVSLSRADTVLLVMRADNNADLWLDTAAVSVRCLVKRSMSAGSVLFEGDIADVVAMAFPCVDIGPTDKVLCLFREGWRFGLAFDFNPTGKLDTEAFCRTLGTLYRQMRFRHLYEAVSDSELFDRLLAAGWFPFIEIINAEFRELMQCCEAGFDLVEIEDKIISKFDGARLQHVFERWTAKPHFASKSVMLREAIDAFVNKKPIAVIKIVLTEIEGVLNDAYRVTHGGQPAKLNELLAFAAASAKQRAGSENTLLFPGAFGRYLRAHTFANFDPVLQTGTAGSRHAVGHGAAAQDSYTMAKALQAILTLDQLAFYT